MCRMPPSDVATNHALVRNVLPDLSLELDLDLQVLQDTVLLLGSRCASGCRKKGLSGTGSLEMSRGKRQVLRFRVC